MKIAFIGIGTMGSPMAGHIAARHAVTVYNRTLAKAEAWAAEHGGQVAASAAEAAAGADAVLVCLPTDADTVAVATGDGGVFAAMAPGALFVDHGSGAATTARMLAAEAEQHGLGFLDAPVTGGRVGAERATLAAMVGGDAASLALVEPALRCFAQDVRHMGAVGAGHVTKMINVIVGHGTGAAMAEGIAFAIRQGLDPAEVVDVLKKGSSQSWQLEHRSGAMIARDYRTLYPVSFARKDLGNVLAEAERAGAKVPLTALADQLYAMLEQAGGSALDTASLIEYFAPSEPEGS